MKQKYQTDYQELRRRIEMLSLPEPNSGCIIWIGAARYHGYGRMKIDGLQVNTTHAVLELCGRPVPPGKFALHKCDNSYCINPDHLFIGDQQDNVDDAKRKGRMNLSGLALGRIGNNKKKRHA